MNAKVSCLFFLPLLNSLPLTLFIPHTRYKNHLVWNIYDLGSPLWQIRTKLDTREATAGVHFAYICSVLLIVSFRFLHSFRIAWQHRFNHPGVNALLFGCFSRDTYIHILDRKVSYCSTEPVKYVQEFGMRAIRHGKKLHDHISSQYNIRKMIYILILSPLSLPPLE